MPLLLLVALLPLVVLALMPLILIQRYRAGTARRKVRPSLATLTVALMTFSALCFLAGAAVTTVWVPNAFTGAAAGIAAGAFLGLVGLALTRWEPTSAALHYTPNRALVLIVTFIVSARVLYGLWRSWTVAKGGVGGGRHPHALRRSLRAFRRSYACDAQRIRIRTTCIASSLGCTLHFPEPHGFRSAARSHVRDVQQWRRTLTGTIRTLRVDKGFGFIKDDSGKEYFFHQSAVYGEGIDNLREGDSVEFDVGQGPKGPRAENVRRTST